jgi:hypothetical protein
MGTSVSHGSPRSTNWKRVFICYDDNNLPNDRIINEIWRASDNQPSPISSELKSSIVYLCFDAINTSKNFKEALNKFDTAIFKSKSNSIIAEFAKRAIPTSFQSENPPSQWTKNFFSEITNYIISRDASGFVGKNYRNKTVSDLINFKQMISNKVESRLQEKIKIKSHSDWNTFIDSTLSNLKSK